MLFFFKQVPKVPNHKAVIINVNLDASRGSVFWKLNRKWLEDELYRNNIESIIQTACYNNIHLEDDLIWDLCEIKIKEFSIKYAI